MSARCNTRDSSGTRDTAWIVAGGEYLKNAGSRLVLLTLQPVLPQPPPPPPPLVLLHLKMTRLSAFAFCALALTAASTISAFPFAKRDDGSGGASVTSPTPTSTPLALCLIENGLIHVDNITSGITCVGRSDVSGDALTNGSSTVVFGLPTNSSNVTVSLYSDDQCQVLVAVIPCQELPPTTCFINYTGVIVVETVYSDVR